MTTACQKCLHDVGETQCCMKTRCENRYLCEYRKCRIIWSLDWIIFCHQWSHQVLQVVLLAYCPLKISMLELRQWTCTTSAALVISFDMFLGSVFVLEQSWCHWCSHYIQHLFWTLCFVTSYSARVEKWVYGHRRLGKLCCRISFPILLHNYCFSHMHLI